jgi:putative ubiquitin-RnfH superfamily antitoxin RatB of RatAB toxin-antitoxin module
MVDKAGLIEVEVAYAKSEEQVIITLAVSQGTTAEQAVTQSGLLVRFPEISNSELKIGIFGAVCKPEQMLNQGDRVEIYHPLIHDPKEARRQRALKK